MSCVWMNEQNQKRFDNKNHKVNEHCKWTNEKRIVEWQQSNQWDKIKKEINFIDIGNMRGELA